jgi:hypothetical protein
MANSKGVQNAKGRAKCYKMFKLVLECKCKCNKSVQNAKEKVKYVLPNVSIAKVKG